MRKRFICLAVCLMLGLVGCKNNKENVQKIDTYVTSMPQKIYLDGEVEYVNQKTFTEDSSKGTIDKVSVKDGQAVKAGDVLFTYSNSTVIDQFNSLSTQLKQLKDQYDSLKKGKSMVKNIPNEAAKDDINQDNLQVNSEEDIKDEMAKNLDNQHELKKRMDEIAGKRYSDVKAPFDGTVTILDKDNEATGKEILKLTDTKMHIESSVSEKDILKLKNGQKVKILIGATNENTSGTIKSISKEPAQNPIKDVPKVGNTDDAASNITYYPVYIDIDKQSGYYVDFHVQVEAKAQDELPKIPKKSVFTDKDRTFVWKVVNNKAVKTQVNVKSLNDSYYNIESGLDFGSKIIREGSAKVKEGDPVE